MFLICAQKKSIINSSKYIIFHDEKGFDDSKSILGKLKSNFLGTHFNLYKKIDGTKEINATIKYVSTKLKIEYKFLQ